MAGLRGPKGTVSWSLVRGGVRKYQPSDVICSGLDGVVHKFNTGRGKAPLGEVREHKEGRLELYFFTYAGGKNARRGTIGCRETGKGGKPWGRGGVENEKNHFRVSWNRSGRRDKRYRMGFQHKEKPRLGGKAEKGHDSLTEQRSVGGSGASSRGNTFSQLRG